MNKLQKNAVIDLFQQPLLDLVYRAHTIHRENFSNNKVQISQLFSVKTGSCPEDCAYCPQSAHYKTDIIKEPVLAIEPVLARAKAAQGLGITRFCIGAAWRSPPKKSFPVMLEMIKGIKNLGLETCATLGMLTEEQAQQLKEAGLDFYNHNLDTSPEYYAKVVTTRTYADRLETIQRVRDAGIKVCCGGILSMGETRDDRIELVWQLYKLQPGPESITINRLSPVPGTPFANVPVIDLFEFVRVIAIARILFPKSYIRLSAGRHLMSDELQALCFMAGMNSIFYGEKLFTTKNPGACHDEQLLQRLGLEKMTMAEVVEI
jgi:biotin synthase